MALLACLVSAVAFLAIMVLLAACIWLRHRQRPRSPSSKDKARHLPAALLFRAVTIWRY